MQFFCTTNFTIEEFQTASARKRQINADNAAVDGIFPCLQRSTGMYSVCMRYWYWRTTGGMFQGTSFFLNKNLITTEDLYEYYFWNVS